MKKVDVSIVIVAYKSEETIKDCLESIVKTVKRNSFEIIISDNSPNDLTEEVISDLKGQVDVQYIKNAENLGFSKANNIGIKKVRGNNVLFLNPDTIVYENTIDYMVDFMSQHPDTGAATCKVVLASGELDDASHRGFPTPWNSLSHFSGLAKVFPTSKIFGGYNQTYKNLSRVHEIDALAGSFMIVPNAIGEKLGWWDEDFFFYGEDLDFCYRIKKAGYKIYFVPDVSALHFKGVSSGIKKSSEGITKATNETKKLATDHRFKAMEIFYNKHYKNKYPKILTAAVLLGISLKKQLALKDLK